MAKNGDSEIPARIISANKKSDGSIYNACIAFKAQLEPLSFVSFSILPAEKVVENEKPAIRFDAEKLTAVTPFYEIRLSQNGGINYIKDISTGKMVTGGNGRALFFEGKIDGTNSQSYGKWIVQTTGEDAPWLKMTEYGFISSIPYQFEMTIFEDDPRIECSVRFDFNGQKIGLLSNDLRDSHSPFVHEEKLRFKFFPAIDTASTGVRDLPFAISETQNRYIEGNYWTALSDGKSGIACFNRGNMGSIREKDNSFSVPLAYSMYYVWGTRILYGKYDYEFAIVPFEGNWKKAGLHRKALEYSFGAPAFESKPGEGKSSDVVKDFRVITDDDVQLTALYPKNGRIIARFFRSGDRSDASSFDMKVEDRQLVETNLDGQVIRNIEGKINMKPWEFKTVEILNK